MKKATLSKIVLVGLILIGGILFAGCGSVNKATETGTSSGMRSERALTEKLDTPIIIVKNDPVIPNLFTISIFSKGLVPYGPEIIVKYTTNNITPSMIQGYTYSSPFNITTDGLHGKTIKAYAYKSITSSSNLAEEYVGGKLATPIITPGGGTFDYPVKVSILCPTRGSRNIYYTTDGSDPRTSRSRFGYSAPFSFGGGIIKAAAHLPSWFGCSDSDIATTRHFEVNKPVVPTFSPSGGTFTGGVQPVTINELTAGADVYFTTTAPYRELIETGPGQATITPLLPAATTPKLLGSLHTLWLQQSTTITAYAVKSSYISSKKSAKFTKL